MKIVQDKELQYKDLLLKHLREHNMSFTGEKKYEEKILYVVDDYTMIGALQVTYSWDWIKVRRVIYKNLEVLESLLSKVNELFPEASGIESKVYDEKRAEDLNSLGFKKLGTIKGTDQLADISTFVSVNQNYTERYFVFEGAEIEHLTESLIKEDTKHREEHGVTKIREEIGFAAFDGDTYLGGIIGEFRANQMYIDLLVVTKEGRGTGVGTKLMNTLEEYAMSQYVTNFHVGTAEFQAKGFYEKLGYVVKMTFQDYPKGFECYNLQKIL